MNTKPILLVVAGLAALGLGVYVMFGGYGNSNTAQIAYSSGSDTSSCAAAVEMGERLDPFATGEVAGFRPVDDPLDLSIISFLDGDGNAKSLADWKGKLVLFNLWATWCPPCREEMPWFEELQQAKGGSAFQVVPVSIDLGDPAKPKKFYEAKGLEDLPFLHDNTMEAFQILKKKAVALGMPTTLLVDENTCAIGVLNGPARWAGPDAFNFVDKAIAIASND